MSNISKTKRIAKNTTFITIRMIVVMIINLYIVRVVLDALGVEDYGIFNVVAGVITSLSFLSNVLATSTQRFYSMALGEDNNERFKNIFSASINIYIIFSILVLIVGETIGLWFVNNQLVIPETRMIAVNYVYQFSIFSFIFSILQVPFLSAIISHEDVQIYAIINICEWILKLTSATLLFIIPFDKLIVYSGSLFIIPLLVLLAYFFFTRHKYLYCHYVLYREIKLYKELLSFSGWSLYGSVASVGMNQVNTILVNLFFGPLVNTSRAIALQINSALNSFTSNVLLPLRPPMVKSYSEGDYIFLNKIFNLSNKFIYYLLLMICVPLMFEMEIILKLWLNIDDFQTVLFSRLIIIYMFIMSLNNPISIIIQATGHVKEYHTKVEIFTFLCVPATYVLFKIGYPAHTTFITMIIAAILSHITRLICLKKYYKPFSYNEYIYSFILPAILVTVLTSTIVFIIHSYFFNILFRLLLVLSTSFISTAIFAIIFGLTKSEKFFLRGFIIKSK
ncbi:MATE family efflux transporter [Proteiniphilum propionicum]|jgi:O-antigen/teichoic acid export membrane protein|uniref:polysaccharide biosynthesis protein n=1 Tax=Proteiniphilum propionicum TaxID=2829812 RepID=UPI001EEA1658|nr:polysaccharide biosynthesis protein [Proteiniphilum propionicum]ULB33523.1 polysaccharide biosynthesis protein [Proteiniphilum propionicum]